MYAVYPYIKYIFIMDMVNAWNKSRWIEEDKRISIKWNRKPQASSICKNNPVNKISISLCWSEPKLK